MRENQDSYIYKSWNNRENVGVPIGWVITKTQIDIFNEIISNVGIFIIIFIKPQKNLIQSGRVPTSPQTVKQSQGWFDFACII